MTQESKHQNPARQRKAYAPYNFVPLPEAIVKVDSLPEQDIYHCSNRYTGFIDCTLTTLTPLYTRCMMDPEFFRKYGEKVFHELGEVQKNKRAEFFHINDAQKPVIPASSLRGMVRSLVEIVGYSKLEWVTNRQLFFRTVDDTAIGRYYRKRMGGNVEAGFLRYRDGYYYIKTCQFSRVRAEVLGCDRDTLYQGRVPNRTARWNGTPHQHQSVWVELSSNGRFVDQLKYEEDFNLQEGRLVITGEAPRRDDAEEKKEFVFLLPSPQAEEIEVDNEILLRFHDNDQITQWQEKAFPKDQPEANSRPRDGMLVEDLRGEGEPVFFLRENEALIFFGRAQMFRLPYQKSPLDLTPEYPSSKTDLDLAKAIFGYVKDKKESKSEVYAGRVFFTDAQFEKETNGLWLSEQDPIITPRILSDPKPTSFQHYLVQDNPNNKDELAHYDSPTFIRGHKLYWHKNGKVSQQNIQENNQDNIRKSYKQYTRIKPVKEGVTFGFKIYFENLSLVELGVLLWAIILPGPGQYRHKLGMGKPLGLGTVEVRSILHLDNRHNRYSKLFDTENGWSSGETHQEVIPGNSFERINLSHPNEQTKAIWQQAIQAFENLVLSHTTINPNRRAKSFTEIERIQMLLSMLRWPGPDNQLTDYMQLRSDDRSRPQFRYRPVLPDPLHIMHDAPAQPQTDRTVRPSIQPKAMPSKKNVQSPQLEPRDEIKPPPPSRPVISEPESPIRFANAPVKPVSPPEPELSHPATEAEVETGMYLEGQVIRVEASRVVVDIGVGAEASLPKEKVVPAVRDEHDLEVRFRPGKRIKVFVSGRNKKGRLQLTMQRP